jgi:hypothetical protein
LGRQDAGACACHAFAHPELLANLPLLRPDETLHSWCAHAHALNGLVTLERRVGNSSELRPPHSATTFRLGWCGPKEPFAASTKRPLERPPFEELRTFRTIEFSMVRECRML